MTWLQAPATPAKPKTDFGVCNHIGKNLYFYSMINFFGKNRHRNKNIGAKNELLRKAPPNQNESGIKEPWDNDAGFAPAFLGFSKDPVESNSHQDSHLHYRKKFFACAIFFCTTVLCSFQSTKFRVQLWHNYLLLDIPLLYERRGGL